MLRRPYFIAAVLLIFTALFPSCKEGRTDPRAINYDRKAKSESGTCLYCDTGSYTSNVTSRAFQFDTSFQQIDVADFVFTQQGLSQKGNGCRTIGLAAGQGCDIKLVIKNVNPRGITGSYSIFFSNSEGVSAWSSFNSFTAISPGDSLVVGTVVSEQCDTIEKGFFNIQLSNVSFF